MLPIEAVYLTVTHPFRAVYSELLTVLLNNHKAISNMCDFYTTACFGSIKLALG